MDYKELISSAVRARENSYSPYSNFKVGAAVLCGDRVFTGCNVENAAYGETVCAERVAVLKAVSEGEREVSAVAVAGGRENVEKTFPCGSCRQVIAEFAKPHTPIIIAKSEEDFEVYKAEELLPNTFAL